MKQRMWVSWSKARCGELEHTLLMKFLESSNVFAGKNRPRFGKMESWAHQWLTMSVNGKQTQGNMQINNEILNVQASGAQAWRGPLRTFGNWMWKRMSGRRAHPKPLGIAKTRIWKMMCKQTSQCEERWIWNLKKWVDVGTILNHSGLWAKKSMVLNVTLRSEVSGSWLKRLMFCNKILWDEVSIWFWDKLTCASKCHFAGTV